MQNEVVCVKCSSAKAVAYGRQREPLCKICLCDTVESKFRTVFKTKGAIQRNDRVLLEADGSVESQSALHLLLHFHDPDRSRLSRGKTQFSLEILHLENPDSQGNENVDSAVQDLLACHEGSRLDVNFVHKTIETVEWSQFTEELDSTAIQDLKNLHRRNTVLQHAKQENCNIIVDLKTVTSVAQKVISDSCKGKGYSIPANVSLFDDRVPGVKIVRLLRDLTVSELTLYCRFQKIETIAPPLKQLDTVDALVEQFIHTVQDSFPSGVSSIVSMASKLQPFQSRGCQTPLGSSEEGDITLCALCTEPVKGTYCHSCQKHIIDKMDCSQMDSLTQLAFVLGSVYFKYSVNHEDAMHRINPVVFAFVREVVAGGIMCSVAHFTTRVLPRREDFLQFLIIGTLLYCNQLFYILGVELSGVVIATCMQPAIPVFTAALAISLGKESASVGKSIGILAASAGAICMIAGGNEIQTTPTTTAAESNSEVLLGNLFLFLNTVAMALYYVFAKPVLGNYPPMAVAAWAYMIAATIMGITAVFYNQVYQLDWYLPQDAYGPLFYWIFICSVCGYYIIAWAMANLPSTQVATFQCLQPLVGTFLGFLILGEELTVWDLGAIGVIVGLLMVNRNSQISNSKQVIDSNTSKALL
eukprot:g8203.t1